MSTKTDRLIHEAVKAGFKKEHAEKGYAIFESDYMGGALHIERIDIIGKFNTDSDAADQAEKDGIKLINNLPDCVDDEDMARFIDDPKNREIISKHLKEKYSVDWH